MNLPTSQEIIDDMAFFDDWEQRYQYLIDLGKHIPDMDEHLKTEDRLVRGCQSSVWLNVTKENDTLCFQVASDAIIVNGLLALVLAAFNHKTAEQILAFDIENFFNELDLQRHITPSRGNGLKSIVAKIQAIASAEKH